MNTTVPTIFKFALGVHDEIQRIKAPHIVKVLDVQIQDGQPFMWALVWENSRLRKYVVLCNMTGDEIAGATSYLGTVQLPNGIVLHYFGGGPGL